MDPFDLSRSRGERLSAKSKQMLAVFEGTNEVMDVERAWRSANCSDTPISRSGAYRAIRDLHQKGYLAVNALLGSRVFYQRAREVPLINLVDIDSQKVTTFADEDLVHRIRAAISAAGFDLVGGIDLRVVPKDSAR